ncbi:MAG: hypothetical protein OEZ22_12935 [Spirochaetia bacterium]|nr:hypothetical protein [Spirochaetia bacterium]
MPEISQTNTDSNAHLKLDEFLKTQKNNKNEVIRDKRGDILDKDSFLKLLITELSHQDPLQPVNDREFISQMAQFSALEQMNNVANSMNSLKTFQANLLIGHHISGRDFVSSKIISGKVDKIIYDQKGEVFFRVNGKSVKMDDLVSVELSPDNNNLKPQNVSRETLNDESMISNENSSNKNYAIKNYNENQKNIKTGE